MIQIIVYSLATGRVRRVIDPQENVPSALAFLEQCGIVSGEGRIVYNKLGGGQDTLAAWQAAVNNVTGKNPDSAQSDWYCVIDANNNIATSIIADPTCGDGYTGYTLVNAPWGANPAWTYTPPSTFTPPVIPTKV